MSQINQALPETAAGAKQSEHAARKMTTLAEPLKQVVALEALRKPVG